MRWLWLRRAGSKDSEGVIHRKPKFAAMRITELRLVNFKRVMDLALTGIPADAKLVLLIGANDSGGVVGV